MDDTTSEVNVLLSLSRRNETSEALDTYGPGHGRVGQQTAVEDDFVVSSGGLDYLSSRNH